MDFPRIRSTFGVTPYNPDRDTDEKRRRIMEHYQDQVGAQPLPEEKQPYNAPFPPGQFAQEEFDDMLQRRVVDPLAKAGFEDLGAGLAAVPSAAHSMIVPQTEFDAAATLIPLPAIAKLMKKGKFRKISKAMHVEDPENAAEIIAKQASKEVPPSAAIEGPKGEVRAIDEKEMLRKADESNAREKAIDKMLRTAEPASDWTKIKDNADYLFDGQKIKGKDLREELLQMSTGDFHTAKWELYNPKKDMFKADQKAKMKQDTANIEERLKIVEPPKGPKGDPEASLPRQPDKFSAIRSQLDVAPARMDERGKAYNDVGQSDFTPYDRPNVIREDVPRRNYVESEMDPVEQTITKILSDPKLQNVSPEQKQALANFVRYRYERNKGITNEYGFEKMLGLKDDPRSITGLSGPESKIADYDMLRKMHANEALDAQLDEYSSGWKAYNDLDKYFGRDQAIMSKRHPAVNRMMNALSEDQPFGRSDTIFDQSKDLQDKMYKGRPSHSEEQAKLFPKVKEAVKSEAPRAKVDKKNKSDGAHGRYRVTDKNGSEEDFGHYNTYEDAEKAIQRAIDEGTIKKGDVKIREADDDEIEWWDD